MNESGTPRPSRSGRITRWSWVALALLSAGLAWWFVAARREVRLTLYNGSGETLRIIRVEYGGRTFHAPDVVAGGSTTLTLRLRRPSPSTEPRASRAILRYEMADGTPMAYPAWLDNLHYWARIQFHAARHPNGTPLLFQLGGPSPWFLPFHELLGWMRGR